MSETTMICEDLVSADETCRGRVFLFASQRAFLDSHRDALDAAFFHRFYDEDDDKRMAFIEARLSRDEAIPVEINPTEEAPTWGVFLRIQVEAGQAPVRVWGCTIFSKAAVLERLRSTGRPFFETRTIQVVEDTGSSVQVIAGVENWIRRIWPSHPIPLLLLERWPEIEVQRSVAKLPD